MNGIKHFIVLSIALVAGAATVPDSSPTATGTTSSFATEAISKFAARMIADAIPREYARTKDWGRTREITTGVRSSGNFFDFDIHRQKSTVNDGIWKSYRVTLVDPDKNLEVRIDNLRQEATDRIALTLFVTAKLHGWARAKIYESGVHIISLEAEGDTTVNLWLDTQIAVAPAAAKTFLPGITIHPQVTSTRIKLDDFRLTRISDLHGDVVKELSSGLRHLAEDELTDAKLTAKINQAIEKRRDKLTFTPEMLFSKSTAKGGTP